MAVDTYILCLGERKHAGYIMGDKGLNVSEDERPGASGWETDKISAYSHQGTIVLAKGLNPDEGGAQITLYTEEVGGSVFSVGSITVGGVLKTPFEGDLVDRGGERRRRLFALLAGLVFPVEPQDLLQRQRGHRHLLGSGGTVNSDEHDQEDRDLRQHGFPPQ